MSRRGLTPKERQEQEEREKEREERQTRIEQLQRERLERRINRELQRVEFQAKYLKKFLL
jgi:hypothetical protein